MQPAEHTRFVALLGEHNGILYKVANAYCRARDDRADLIQEIVVQLWRAFPRYDERQRFSTWMYRVAMNVAISFYRKEWRHQRDLVPLDEPALSIAGADAVVGGATDELRRLHEQLQTLGELDRALVLLYLDGYAHAEIAAVMGLTATNVSTRIGRLKKKLQQEGTG